MGDSVITTSQRLAAARAVYETGESMKSEMDRRQSATEALLHLFQAKPMTWIAWTDLAESGGNLGWRTRVSDARKIVQRAGGRIEWNKNIRDSRYRFVPYEPLGRDAGTFVARGWTQDGPYQEPFRLTAPKA